MKIKGDTLVIAGQVDREQLFVCLFMQWRAAIDEILLINCLKGAYPSTLSSSLSSSSPFSTSAMSTFLRHARLPFLEA